MNTNGISVKHKTKKDIAFKNERITRHVLTQFWIYPFPFWIYAPLFRGPLTHT